MQCQRRRPDSKTPRLPASAPSCIHRLHEACLVTPTCFGHSCFSTIPVRQTASLSSGTRIRYLLCWESLECSKVVPISILAEPTLRGLWTQGAWKSHALAQGLTGGISSIQMGMLIRDAEMKYACTKALKLQNKPFMRNAAEH